MTFTDDDLKRLKEGVRKAKHQIEIEELLTKQILCALLARLEVAEKCAVELVRLQDSISEEDMNDELIESWRKAAGK